MAPHAAELSTDEKRSFEHHENLKEETAHVAAERGQVATDMYVPQPAIRLYPVY